MENGVKRLPRRPWLGMYAMAVYAFLYLPIFVLILYSFNRSGVGGFPPRHFTFAWYRILFADSAMWDAVMNSVIVAIASVSIAILIGFPAAYALNWFEFPGKSVFRRLILLPLIVPGIVTGISLLILAVSAGLHLSLATVILGHATALISVATTELAAGLEKLDPALEEASADLGANTIETL
jgi:spermidine/putrescine transport system permease protein